MTELVDVAGGWPQRSLLVAFPVSDPHLEEKNHEIKTTSDTAAVRCIMLNCPSHHDEASA